MKRIKSRYIVVFFMLLFYFFILFLTMFARTIHSHWIPNVVITRLKRVEIDGEKQYAIPVKAYHNGNVFIVEVKVKNGENRSFAKMVSVEAKEQDKNYVVVNGLERWDKIIQSSNKTLIDGDEIFIKNKR